MGLTVILSIIDRFSRAVRFIPLRGFPSAFTTAELLFQHIFSSFGIPEDIVSDRGAQFTSAIWRAFMEKLGVSVSLTSGFHPESNGACERSHQELAKFLRMYAHRNPSDWSRYLPWAEIAQNSLTHASTGLTPYQCVLGYQPPFALWDPTPSDAPAVDAWFRRSEQVWGQVHQRVESVVRRAKAQADRSRGPTPTFQVGDVVWVSTRDIRCRRGVRKLLPKFLGPFPILARVNEVSYRLKLPRHMRIHPTFHVAKLKPFISGPLDSTWGESTSGTADSEDPTIYSVSSLLDSRRRNGKIQYLVDWEGFGPEERSWVSAEAILDGDLIQEFHDNFPGRPAPRPRGRPRRRGRPRSSRAAVPPAKELPSGGGNVRKTSVSTPPLSPNLSCSDLSVSSSSRSNYSSIPKLTRSNSPSY